MLLLIGSCHTLDLLITREHDPVISSTAVADRYLPDYAAVLCLFQSSKPDHEVRLISYRRLKSIDLDSLRRDLAASELCTKDYTYPCELTSSYNSTLSTLLDKHAPLLMKKVVCRQRIPWFNDSIKCAIRARRKAERKWRASNTQQDLRAFKSARNYATFLMNCARRDYYTNLIADNGSDQRRLFGITKSLLCVPSDVTSRDDILLNDLANNFGNFFVQKIDGINKPLDALQSSKTLDCAIAEDGCACAVNECSCAAQSESPASATLSKFKLLSQDQVAERVRRAAVKLAH